MLTTSDSLMIP